MRVLCHAQHFKGIGHFVRMHAIARGLGEAHEVYLVDGGRPVPRRPDPRPIELIPLPRLVRAAGRVVGLETDAPVAALVEGRTRLLTRAVERIPDPGALAERCREIASRVPCVECRLGLEAFDAADAADDLIAAILRH